MANGSADESAREGAPSAADQALVRAAQAGNAQALDALVRAHLPRAYAVAFRIMRHREDAEDLVQDAFARAISRLDQMDATRPFAPWLHRIVVTQGFNRRDSLKRRAADSLIESDHADDGPSPARFAERSDLQRRVAQAVRELPDRTRAVVELVELEGFSPAEVAEMLGMAPGTARWHLHEGRRALRALLADFDDHARSDR